MLFEAASSPPAALLAPWAAPAAFVASREALPAAKAARSVALLAPDK